MSLHTAAQHMASRGRGPDTQLMHMAPQEVAGLQALAKSHGGSLTINPETGLPEAGFLSSILPSLIGAGLAATGVGAPMAALMVGGGYGLASGSLTKGLTAGLGAFGGAGIGGALTGAGAANLAASGGAEAANLAGTAVPSIEAINPSNIAASGLDKMGAGITGLGSAAGRNAFMGQMGGGMGLAKAGMMAAAPMLAAPVTKQPEIKSDADMGQRFSFNPGTIRPTPTPDTPGMGSQGQNFGREQNYFNPAYTPIDDTQAKNMYGFADGGEVGAFEYTYDPVSQTYTKKNGQGATTVAPPGMGLDKAGAGDTSPYTMPKQVDNYLTWEESTPEGQAARDTRMQQFGNIASSLGPMGWAVSALTGRPQEAIDYRSLFGNPQAYVDYQESFARGMDPTNGPGTIGSRDSRGSNEPSDSGPNTTTTDAGNSSISDASDSGYGSYALGGITALAGGGASHLGDYSDGGRLLRGPGDGVSDDIPAMIGNKQPARLADGEFVVPARIVSELGNGSTEAGARKLYAMMDRVQKNRSKTVGEGNVAVNSRSDKHLPA